MTLLSALYTSLKEAGFAAFILPKTDAHRSEYCPDRDNLVHFLTGFSGSTGFAALKVMPSPTAAIFVDSRYTLQVQQEVDPKFFAYEKYTLKNIEDWIAKDLSPGDKIAYDPLLLSQKEYNLYVERFNKYGIILEALQSNPLDRLWENRPPVDTPALVPHPLDYAGVPFTQKISLVQDLLTAKGAHGFFLNYSESIAWLFNIRAPDRLVTPAASLYAYVPHKGPCTLFIHAAQKTTLLKNHLKEDVTLESYEDVFEIIASVARDKIIALDGSKATLKMVKTIDSQGGKILNTDDFCALPAACKNDTEQQGARNSHIRDGAAVCNLLAWLESSLSQDTITELDVVNKLYSYRQQQDLLTGYSFDTIAGSGPNGAIVHYRASKESNRTLKETDIFLLDSGGQYLDGTTDITRTISLNKSPTAEQKDRYTRVLKGHISLASAKFPEGTVGSQLDALARYSLWQAGCDYGHGTGHGVGSYLGVHDGPQRISPVPNTTPLMPGMVISNEPGYYKQGEYGIRIESLVIVKRLPKSQSADEANMLCFETLTLVPLDAFLIDRNLMTVDDINWVNAYHQGVYTLLKDLVEPPTKAWLNQATQAL